MISERTALSSECPLFVRQGAARAVRVPEVLQMRKCQHHHADTRQRHLGLRSEDMQDANRHCNETEAAEPEPSPITITRRPAPERERADRQCKSEQEPMKRVVRVFVET